ncbi:polynucleotide adenylyltransferase PcnB [Spirochaetota bacterium]
MLIRYQKGPDGKPVKKAVVYINSEHGINKADIDRDAFWIVERLQKAGFSAYIVGGAVRDLLLGRIPKDYDIVSDAEPKAIKKLFYRSRIIGRRFRLVHVHVGKRIFEISTFRSIANGSVGNTYGNMDEDAKRRDFSINALYFDPVDSKLVDYVGGLKDLRAGKLRAIIPLSRIFNEDPVRMIRAVKYSMITGFSIPLRTRLYIKMNAGLLADISNSRLGEELVKILYSGKARGILELLNAYGLLKCILPGMSAAFDGPLAQAMKHALDELDAYILESGDKTLRFLLAFIIRFAVEQSSQKEAEDLQKAFRYAVDAAKEFLYPLAMPRAELEAAVRLVFRAAEPKAAKRNKRRRRPKADIAKHL